MVVAVNTRFLLNNNLEGFGYFIKETFSRITKMHPEHHFYFLFDRPYSKEYIFSENVTPLLISPPARHPILWRYWYDFKVNNILKKIKADVFVSPDGICSLTTSVPQCLVVHDLGFLHFPKAYNKAGSKFLNKYTNSFLKKANIIATVSEFTKHDIIRNYKIKSKKVKVVYSAAKEIFVPVDKDIQASIRNQYSNGEEYFLYIGAIQPRKNIIKLLKAYEIFKNRSGASVKLILVGRVAWKKSEFYSFYNSFKFKDDVILLNYIDEDLLVKITGSSLALVYPSLLEGFGVPVLEALKCNVPVLTSHNSSMAEIAQDAALYFDPSNENDIAEKMLEMFNDSDQRNAHILKGKAQADKYSWDRTASLLWDVIVSARNIDNCAGDLVDLK